MDFIQNPIASLFEANLRKKRKKNNTANTIQHTLYYTPFIIHLPASINALLRIIDPMVEMISLNVQQPMYPHMMGSKSITYYHIDETQLKIVLL